MDVGSVKVCDLTDEEITIHMRKWYYEKFKTLVRMHLSFELDLNTDEFDLPCHDITYEDKGKLRKWNRMDRRHKTGGTNCSGSYAKASENVVNNNVLTQHYLSNAVFHSRLNELKDFLLRKSNLRQEGIFRKAGSISRQNELRSKISGEASLNLMNGGYTVHDCATVFKAYLSDLPEPLLIDAHYPAHLQLSSLCMSISLKSSSSNLLQLKNETTTSECYKREHRVLRSLQLLILLLPYQNRIILQHFIEVLHAVALNSDANKMSAENLATIFTPHLICPRNLPPEALHYMVKQMFSIITYMIHKGSQIFEIPTKLSTDMRAYYLERKHKGGNTTLQPTLDDSISDISTVNTVYTFVDREKTAEAHSTNNTDTELAQLYAHIQSMPESSKKRRLIKQFNKQNGQGTPLRFIVMNRVKRERTSQCSKTITESIKKHIFQKNLVSRTPKRMNCSYDAYNEEEEEESTVHLRPRIMNQRILFPSETELNTADVKNSGNDPAIHNGMMDKFYTPTQVASSDVCATKEYLIRKADCLQSPPVNSSNCHDDVIYVPLTARCEETRHKLRQPCPINDPVSGTSMNFPSSLDIDNIMPLKDLTIGSNDFIRNFQTLQKRNFTRFSTSCASPVLIYSNDLIVRSKSEPNLRNIRVISGDDNRNISLNRVTLKHVFTRGANSSQLNLNSMKSTKRSRCEAASDDKFLRNRIMKSTIKNTDLLIKDIFEKDLDDDTFTDIPEDHVDHVINNDVVVLDKGEQHQQQQHVHFTGSILQNIDQNAAQTFALDRRSMSPITKSTQRMPKAMQESIMTPRSRKPVVMLTNTLGISCEQNQCDCENTPNLKKNLIAAVASNEGSSLKARYMNSLNSVAEDYNASQNNAVTTTMEHGEDCNEVTILSDEKPLQKGQNVDYIPALDGLTADFKEYLLRRNVLSASLTDLSFCSEHDDCDCAAVRDIGCFNESTLSSNFLYCLDGNQPLKTRKPDPFTRTEIDPVLSPSWSEDDLLSNKDEKEVTTNNRFYDKCFTVIGSGGANVNLNNNHLQAQSKGQEVNELSNANVKDNYYRHETSF